MSYCTDFSLHRYDDLWSRPLVLEVTGIKSTGDITMRL